MKTKIIKPKRGLLDGYKTYDPEADGYGHRRQWRDSFSQRMGQDEAQEIIDRGTEGPYTILGIGKSASLVEIRTAFRTLIMKWHPDKNPGQEELAEEMSKKIIAAHTLLTQKPKK